MKEKTLEQQVQDAAYFNRGLFLPSGERTQRSWPVCQTCFKEVDSVSLENVNNRSCEIRVKCCHSKDPDYVGPMFEDSLKVTWQVPVRDMTKDPTEDPNVGWAIKRAMSDMLPFSPKHQFDFSSKR